MVKVIRRAALFARACRAVTSIEYGLIGALIFLVIVAGLRAVGTALVGPLTTVATTLH